MWEVLGSRCFVVAVLLWPAAVWGDVIPEREREPEPKWECDVPGKGVQKWDKGRYVRCGAAGDACFLRFEGREPVFGTCVQVDCLPISDGEWSAVQRMWCAKTAPARVDPEVKRGWIERGEATCPGNNRSGSGKVETLVIRGTSGPPEEIYTYECSRTLWERVNEEPSAVFAILWRDETGRTLLISAGSVLAGLVLGVYAYRRRD
jgi:hypothetical protein